MGRRGVRHATGPISYGGKLPDQLGGLQRGWHMYISRGDVIPLAFHASCGCLEANADVASKCEGSMRDKDHECTAELVGLRLVGLASANTNTSSSAIWSATAAKRI